VEKGKGLFLERRCVQSSFTAADEKLALSLYSRGVSLTHVERAILLGAVRMYAAVLQNGRGTPISSLHYFTNLFEEVQQEISSQYWTYVAHKGKHLRAKRDWLSRDGDGRRMHERKRGDATGRPRRQSSFLACIIHESGTRKSFW